ncbi:MAG: Fic family protein [Chlamydiae bacterium]|nr:Fic family protein [Chlamydiota bacterium]MBI3265615.1 Fic family protein [Chlamydiota bacterium]
MEYIYGDYPTQKELTLESRSSKEAESRWEKIWHERQAKAEHLSLKTKQKEKFVFVMTPYLLHLITEISEQSGFLEALSLSPSVQTRLKEKAANHEAYYSSHIEGASSSLEEALRFIKKKQKYSADESLQMIKNNRRALDHAIQQIGKSISHDLIWKLQFILTENTHRNHPITVGQYRHGPVYIVNGLGQVIYEGPPHEKVPNMMEDFIQWIHKTDFMNPLIKAGIVHLYFVHVHPFDDGNGRTARALSNLVLANSGIHFINMLALSDYFDHERPSYYKAIQDVRGHHHDLTYFLIFFMEALLAKLKDLRKEIDFESKLKNRHMHLIPLCSRPIHRANPCKGHSPMNGATTTSCHGACYLRGIKCICQLKNLRSWIGPKVYQQMNKRQKKALAWMLKMSEIMTTKKYCKLNQCSDETARKDFQDLTNFKLIEAIGEGRGRGYKLAKAIV